MLHCSLLRVDALTTRREVGHHPSPAKSCLPTPAGRLTASSLRQTSEGHRQLRQYIGSEDLQESDREDDRASRSGQPWPDGLFEARGCEDSVGQQSPPSSQPRPRASLLGSRTAVRHLLHESAAHSDLALVRGIPPAQLQLQAAAVQFPRLSF
jgi:hypothetical protein